MKKISVAILTLLLCSGCARYAVKGMMSGIFMTAQMEGNIMDAEGGIFGGTCEFDLNKRFLAGEEFYGVRIIYTYSGSGFCIDAFDGVRAVIDGKEGFFIKYRKSASCNTVSSTTGGGGYWVSTGTGAGGMMYVPGTPQVTTTTTTIVAECLLTGAELEKLLNAGKLEIDLISAAGEGQTPSKKVFYMSEANMRNIQRFYGEHSTAEKAVK